MHTWADFDIVIPSGAIGEVRLTCPQVLTITP